VTAGRAMSRIVGSGALNGPLPIRILLGHWGGSEERRGYMGDPTNPTLTLESQAAQPEVEVAPLPADATPEQKDEHWYRQVYQGDNMPQLTLRAVLMGGCLGMLMSAANLYTTLTIGWSFGVTITACVISYLLVSSMRWISRGRVTQFSILENNCMASTASAAGASTGATVATMFGALLLLAAPKSITAPQAAPFAAHRGQLAAVVAVSSVPVAQNAISAIACAARPEPIPISSYGLHPWWLIGSFTLLTALMGVFLAIPMKRQMINHEGLRFPTGVATAETLRSLYSRSREAMHKAYALVWGLLAGAIVGVLATGQGVLSFMDRFFAFVQAKAFSIRLPELIPAQGFYKVKNYVLSAFGFEPSLLLIGAGMITGLRVSLSMLAGSALLYMVVGPILIQRGDPKFFMAVGTGPISLIRWGLWGGTAVMVFSSLTALALQWKTIVRAVKGATSGRSARSRHTLDLSRIEVPTSWMVIGLLPIGIGMLIIQMLAFSIHWYAGLIAIGMSFVLSLVASRSTGETDTTPVGAMGKVMQLLFAVLVPGNYHANLASAGTAANSASSSADLLTDLKSGYLLGANPRRQFLAQFSGVFFGTVAIIPIWYLMVPDQATLMGDRYAAPATRQWFSVAQVLTRGIDSLAFSAKIALLIGALLGVAMPLIERLVPTKHRRYYPSAMGLGLSWVVPFNNALSFAVGAFFTWAWEKINPRTADKYNIPLASGFVAGESLVKAFTAMTSTAMRLLGHG